MKKWVGSITGLCVGMSLMFGTAHAAENKHLTLKRETYNYGLIVRGYENDKGEAYEETIEVPYQIRTIAEGLYNTPEEQLHEVKKQMYTAYELLDLKEKLKALDAERVWHPESMPKGDVVVAEPLKSELKKEDEEFYKYAMQKKTEWDVLTPAQKNALYNPLQGEFRDFKTGTSAIVPYTVKEEVKANENRIPKQILTGLEQDYHKSMAPKSVSLSESVWKNGWLWAGLVSLLGIVGLGVWYKRRG